MAFFKKLTKGLGRVVKSPFNVVKDTITDPKKAALAIATGGVSLATEAAADAGNEVVNTAVDATGLVPDLSLPDAIDPGLNKIDDVLEDIGEGASRASRAAKRAAAARRGRTASILNIGGAQGLSSPTVRRGGFLGSV